MNNLENLLEQVQKKQNTLKTDKLGMSFGELVRSYEEDSLIVLSKYQKELRQSRYQKIFRWTTEQKSRFVESILLGMPIPSIFVAENEEGKWELIDGLQRLLTIASFMGKMRQILNNEVRNDWKLQNCSILDSLNSKDFTELPLKLQLQIRRYSCHVEILRSNHNEFDMMNELFDRLNPRQ